jgi:hypothetical protein
VLLGISKQAESKKLLYTKQQIFKLSENNFIHAKSIHQLYEIGEMATQMMYIHVNIPRNLTALFDQADLFTSYLQTLSNTTTSVYSRIPFIIVARDIGNLGLKRLERILKKLERGNDYRQLC